MTKSGRIGTAEERVCACGNHLPVVDGRSNRRRYCSDECKQSARQSRYEPKGPPVPTPLADRLWRRVVEMPTGCWEWQGYRDGNGYGEMGRGARGEGNVDTHRAAWELTYGPIPQGLFVCHRCDNPPCCNPAHLFLGSNADNVADMVTKGREARGFALPQTKLTDEQIEQIREMARRGAYQRDIAHHFGVTQGYVSDLVNGHYRKAS